MPTNHSSATGKLSTETHTRERDGWSIKWISPAGDPRTVLHASARKGNILLHKSGEIWTINAFSPMRHIGQAADMDAGIRMAERWLQDQLYGESNAT